MQYFNKTFYRFLLGFLSIIAFSACLMFFVNHYNTRTTTEIAEG